MRWLKNNKISILLIYLNILFLMRLMQSCYRIDNFNYILVSVLFVLIVSIYYVYDILFKRGMSKLLFISIVVCILSALFYFKRDVTMPYVESNIVDNFNSINNLLSSGQKTSFQLFFPIILIVLPLITFIILNMYFVGITDFVLVINLAVILMFWYLDYVKEVKNNIFIFIVLSIITYSINNHIKNLKKAKKVGLNTSVKFSSIIKDITIYSLIISIVCIILPQNYEGHFTQESMSKLVNPFSPDPKASLAKAKEGQYGIVNSGYSDTEKKLGGPVSLSKTVVLTVKADSAYYLKASVKEEYTGFSWHKKNEKYETKSDYSGSDLNQFLGSALQSVGDSGRRNITITPETLSTSTLFVPNFVSNVSLDRGKIYCESSAMTFVDSLRITRPYSVKFYDPNVVKKYIEDSIKDNNFFVDRDNFADYLQVPDNITERTVQLVYDIVKNCNSNYEKVEKIKAYLNKNYPYTLKTSEVPEGQEFLDYFLFTEKKGYCTYFATAMTMMCRIAGIPARYVEGYRMPEKAVNGVYNVTNEDAHAWSEVLLQGNPDLWVQEDSVPAAEEQTSPQQQAQTNPELTGNQENISNNQQPNVSGNIPKINKDSKDPSDKPMDNNTAKKPIIALKIMIPAILAIIIVLSILIRIIFIISLKKKVINSKSNIPIYNYCLKRLKASGYRKADNITDRDFVNSISDEKLALKLSDLVDKVYAEFYGGIEDDSINKKDIYFEVENYIRKIQNIFQYLFAKIFL